MMSVLKLYYSSLILIILNGCSPSWTTVIQRGSVFPSKFEETIDADIVRGLIIVPVKINGNSYRFLFDSGAPNSISQSLQEEFKFKIISKGSIIDSENSRVKVNYVNYTNKKDTMRIVFIGVDGTEREVILKKD